MPSGFALMTLRFFENISKYIEKRYDECDEFLRFGLESFFAENQDTVKWMHLSNAKSHGWGSDHGLPFTEDTIGHLRHILWLYKKYNYNCPVVLEVREDSYDDAKNYETTHKILEDQLYLLEK